MGGKIYYKIGLLFALMVGSLCIGWTFCAWILQAPYPWEWIVLYRVQAGLERALRDLPLPEGFEMVTVIDRGSPEKGEEGGCYYAGVYIVLGTIFGPEDAMSRYVLALEDQGWYLVDSEGWEWSMARSEQEEITIRAQGPGPIIEMEPAYQQARERFPTFIYITLRYILPRVRGC